MDRKDFWEQVHRVAKQAGRAYLATVYRGKLKARVVFPAFEGEKVWIATRPSFAKTAQIALDPRVELFWETGASRPAPNLTRVARRIDDQRENGSCLEFEPLWLQSGRILALGDDITRSDTDSSEPRAGRTWLAACDVGRREACCMARRCQIGGRRRQESGSLFCALRDEALDFFGPESDVVAQSD